MLRTTPIAAAHIDTLDDAEGIVPWEGGDYFALLLTEYLAAGKALRGKVGQARSEIIDSNDLAQFAVEWMRIHLGRTAMERLAIRNAVYLDIRPYQVLEPDGSKGQVALNSGGC